MSFQSRKHQLVLHPVRPFKTFYDGEITVIETICIRNPYEFNLCESENATGCWLNYRGITIQLKETINEIAEKYDAFKKGYEEESREVLYNASPSAISMMM